MGMSHTSLFSQGSRASQVKLSETTIIEETEMSTGCRGEGNPPATGVLDRGCVRSKGAGVCSVVLGTEGGGHENSGPSSRTGSCVPVKAG